MTATSIPVLKTTTTALSLQGARTDEPSGMNTCDTCKFWGPETAEPNYHNFEPVRACRSGKIKFSTFGHEDDCVLIAEDNASAYSINTGPKFGCIHHQPIDTPHLVIGVDYGTDDRSQEIKIVSGGSPHEATPHQKLSSPEEGWEKVDPAAEWAKQWLMHL